MRVVPLRSEPLAATLHALTIHEMPKHNATVAIARQRTSRSGVKKGTHRPEPVIIRLRDEGECVREPNSSSIAQGPKVGVDTMRN